YTRRWSRRAADCAAGAAGSFRRDGRREADDLRPGSWAGTQRHARRPKYFKKRGEERLRHAIDHSGDRPEFAVPDADQVNESRRSKYRRTDCNEGVAHDHYEKAPAS